MKTKKCSKCGKVKSISEFHKNRTCKDGLSYVCKKCTSIRQKEYRANNPVRFWCTATINNHKRKGLKVLFKSKELFLIAEKITHCSLCDNKLQYSAKASLKNATLDRINNEKFLTLDNTQIICWGCNVTKSKRTMKEFIDYCSKICKKFKNVV